MGVIRLERLAIPRQARIVWTANGFWVVEESCMVVGAVAIDLDLTLADPKRAEPRRCTDPYG
jgi:hypothetical protein